jgi:predicted DNA-binding protein
MAYKGSDLELRLARPLPIPVAAGPAERTAATPAGAVPIEVDEAVLACCNCAYDVALFHASDAVRLQHLLHALTRVAAGADVLTELGIRVDKLRRETAVAIAAEMPAGPIEHNSAPLASAAFEDVLRRSAEQADKRRMPVGLHDVMRTLLSGGPGSPATTLLMQAAADPPRLERWRDESRREALISHLATGNSDDPLPGTREALREHLGPIEATLSTLRDEVAADRKMLADLLHDMRSDLQTLRSETGRTTGAVGVEAISALLEAKFGELGKATAALAERLPAIDKLTASDASPALRSHIEAVEGRLDAHAPEIADKVVGSLAEHFSLAEDSLQRLQERIERQLASSAERQIALEASLRAQLQAAEEARKAHEQNLSEIHKGLVKLGANQQTLGENFAAWRGETGGDIGIVSNRLQQLEHNMLDLLGQLGGELQALRQENHGNGTKRSHGFKRWLYGTSSVFTPGRREEATPDSSSAPQAPARPPGEQPS